MRKYQFLMLSWLLYVIITITCLCRGFLHAHVSYLSDTSPACLMLLSNDREKFFTLQDCRQKIVAVSRPSVLYVSVCRQIILL